MKVKKVSEFQKLVDELFIDVELLKEAGGDVVFDPSAEAHLVKLLEIKDAVEGALEHVKDRIAEAGRDVDPGFKGFKGGVVDATYRKYGKRFEYDWKNRDVAMPFLNQKTYYSVDADKVDEYIETVGEMPEGIKEKDREAKLSIKFKDERKTLHGN